MPRRESVPDEQKSYRGTTCSTVAVQTGHLVRSIMGRDRGKFYLVISKDDLSRVRLADGEVRKVENPKNKKVKHLEVYDLIAGGLVAKAESGKRITNVDVRQELKSLLHDLNRCSL